MNPMLKSDAFLRPMFRWQRSKSMIDKCLYPQCFLVVTLGSHLECDGMVSSIWMSDPLHTVYKKQCFGFYSVDLRH